MRKLGILEKEHGKFGLLGIVLLGVEEAVRAYERVQRVEVVKVVLIWRGRDRESRVGNSEEL